MAVGLSFAQSNDAEYPTPVRENFIEGRILARDLGDARLTQHFYVFTGSAGDLSVKVECANLEGDLDIFRANGLQPVLKIGLYSGGGASLANKGAYLKRRETLILRIEGRTPDEQPGTYKITFSGAFEVYGGPEITPPPIASATPGLKPKVRVNAAGARLEDPEAAKPKPTPTPVETIAAAPAKPKGRLRTPKPTPTPTVETPTESSEPESGKTVPLPPKPKTVRAKKPTRNKPTPAPPTAPKPEAIEVTPPAETPPTTTEAPAATPPATTDAPVTAPPVKPKSVPKAARPKPPVVQTQLLLELKDGTRVVRENVRRVTIEKGAIVVITADGKLERYALLDVARMSVEPTVITEPQ